MFNFKKLISLISIILLASSLFVGCGNKKADDKTLNIFNAGDYIDPDLVKTFEKKTGINVNYEVFETNEIMYQKLKANPSSYDLVFPSDYMIEKLIKENLLDKLDFNNIPNYKNINEKFKHLSFDPNDEYAVPYMWGTVGILYNKKVVKEPVDSWNILWNPKYKGDIFMLDSIRDSLGLALKKIGYSLNTTNQKEIDEAKKELEKQKPNVLAYVGDEVKDRMLANEGSIGIVYSGDAVHLMEKDKDLQFVVPKEGSNIWVDGMVVPKDAKHKALAEKFINFMLDPEIAKQNVEYIGYSTTNKAAFQLLDEDVRENKIAYPEESTLKNCEIFKDLGPNIKKYDDAWLEIKSK